MIWGTGIDMVKISRFESWKDDEKMQKRFFHDHEIEYAKEAAHKSASSILAARFAAKEAFVKALGLGFRDIKLKDIAVEKDALGKPLIAVYNSAKEKLPEGARVHLSLCHEGDYALAHVLIEKL